jgi:hypothetical protein
MVIELTPQNVEATLVYCLYNNEELKNAKTRFQQEDLLA